MNRIKQLLNSEQFSRHFELSLAFIIIASVICFTLGTLPDLSVEAQAQLDLAEHFFIAVFTLEYVIRIYKAPSRLGYIFSFYGIIDLLAILPYYLVAMFGAQPLRLLALFRVLRIMKLTRYLGALRRFYLAINQAREELIIFFAASMIIIFLAAVGIYHFEHEAQPEAFRSFFDALWWAVVTLTTVGYGDLYPITDGGRMFTFIVLLTGLGLIAVPTGIIASSLNSIRRDFEHDDADRA